MSDIFYGSDIRDKTLSPSSAIEELSDKPSSVISLQCRNLHRENLSLPQWDHMTENGLC